MPLFHQSENSPTLSINPKTGDDMIALVIQLCGSSSRDSQGLGGLGIADQLLCIKKREKKAIPWVVV